MVWNYQNADCSLRKKCYRVIYYNFRNTFVPCLLLRPRSIGRVLQWAHVGGCLACVFMCLPASISPELHVWNCRWTDGISTRKRDNRSNHESQNTDAQLRHASTDKHSVWRFVDFKKAFDSIHGDKSTLLSHMYRQFLATIYKHDVIHKTGST